MGTKLSTDLEEERKVAIFPSHQVEREARALSGSKAAGSSRRTARRFALEPKRNVGGARFPMTEVETLKECGISSTRGWIKK